MRTSLLITCRCGVQQSTSLRVQAWTTVVVAPAGRTPTQCLHGAWCKSRATDVAGCCRLSNESAVATGSWRHSDRHFESIGLYCRDAQRLTLPYVGAVLDCFTCAEMRYVCCLLVQNTGWESFGSFKLLQPLRYSCHSTYGRD
jgi:hypothetical protein